MGFDAFERLAPFRDCDRLRSGISFSQLSDERDFQTLGERKRQWSAIVTSCGTRYADASPTNFKTTTDDQKRAVELVRAYVKSFGREPPSNSLVLIGPPGTGKDHLAMAVLRWAVFQWGYVSAWCDGQAWFGAVRDSYAEDDTESSLVRFAVRSQIFGISDPIPSNGAITEHQRNVLFRLIDGRYRNMLPTIATMNVATRKELNDRLGDSLADRICDDAFVVPMNWQSHRTTA